jgi:hypothetical protein
MIDCLEPAAPCAALKDWLDPETSAFVDKLYAAGDAELVADEVGSAEEEELTEENEGGENFVLQYELSHDDIRSALYSLLGAESENGYCYAWIIEVYDSKFIYQDDTDCRFYRRGYNKDGDNVSLSDDTVEVFNEWLSKDEKDALDTLKSDYAALKAFKDNYDAAELKALKDAIFGREEFSVLAENEAFIELQNAMDNFTVEEIESKAKQIFADHVIKNGQFAMNKTAEPKESNKIGFNYTESSKKNSAYGGLFDD